MGRVGAGTVVRQTMEGEDGDVVETSYLNLTEPARSVASGGPGQRRSQGPTQEPQERGGGHSSF